MTQASEFRPCFASSSRSFSLALAVLAILGFPRVSSAQTGAETVSAGAAVAGVVVEVIGGLSSWLNDQSDDCAVAGLGAAWGKDCDLKQKECTDTGYICASCYETASNDCAYATGGGYSCEGAFGSWSGCEIHPYAFGFVKALHNSCDTHNYRAWGKAAIDGTSRAETNGSPGSGGAPSLTPVSLPGPAPVPQWPRGTVLVVAKLDTLTLQSTAGKPGSGKFSARLKVNGSQVWTVTARLNNAGQVTTTGPLNAGSFRVSQDPLTGRYTAVLTGYRYEHPVDTLAFAAPGILSPLSDSDADQTTTDVGVSMESETEADGSNGSDGVCAVQTVATCMNAMSQNADGTYVYVGEHVAISNAVTILSPSQSSLFLDTYVTDGTTVLRVVDPFQPAGSWREGQKVALSGYPALLDGDFVMTRVSFGTSRPKIEPHPVPRGEIILGQNEPNPFNPVTSIAFRLTRPGPVRLEIYSVAGRLVRTLADDSFSAGDHELIWDGRDDAGRSVSSGVYLYTLEAGKDRVSRKMLMAK